MVMQKDQIWKRLEGINNLPSLPAVIQRLGVEINNRNADANGIARIIEDDPSMMARILKVVNSAMYAGAEPITSVNHAIARIGFSAVNNIALSTAVFSTFGKAGEKNFDRVAFWQHCICTGAACEVICDRIRAPGGVRYSKDLLHLVGLLHDVGKIIFEQYFHEEFMESVELCGTRHIPLFQIELECIGADHSQVGAWLGAKWKLPRELCEVIRWHHEPHNAIPEHQDLAMLCHVANYVCNIGQLGDSGDSVAPAFFPSVWQRFGLDTADIPELCARVKEEADKSAIMLSFM